MIDTLTNIIRTKENLSDQNGIILLNECLDYELIFLHKTNPWPSQVTHTHTHTGVFNYPGWLDL